MPSGKQSKRLRAAEKPPPVRSGPRPRQASTRVLVLAAGLILLVAAAAGLAFALTGGDSEDAAVTVGSSVESAIEGAGETQRRLQGIDQDGNVLGSPSAPVTVYEYIDPQCPYCQQFETQAMPSLIERYVRTGKAKVELRPLAFIGPDSQTGRAALIAGGEQDRMFNVAQLLFLNQGAENGGWLSDDLVRRVAAGIPGVDVQRFVSDAGSTAVADEGAAFDAAARAAGVNSTPTILVAKTGGEPTLVALTDPTDSDSVAKAIDTALGSG
jgi:protein-disulfide isomerase